MAPDGAHAQALRRRSATWRTTAGRIRAISDGRWPHWLLQHLQTCERLSEVGPEYARQRALLSAHLTGSAGAPPPPEPGGAPREKHRV